MRSHLLSPLLCIALSLPHAADAAPRRKAAPAGKPPAQEQAAQPPAQPPAEEAAPAPPEAPQSADELEEVRQLDQQVKLRTDAAEQHLKARRYELAVRELQEAYKLDAQPVFLFKAGQAYHRMGKLDEAIGMYEDFLREEPTTPLRRETEGYLSELRAQKERESRPLWKKGWFWGVLGGAVVVVAGIGVGLAFGLRSASPTTIDSAQ